MSSKHFFADATVLVDKALHSITLANPSLALDAENKVVYRRQNPADNAQKAAIISGGGSGHEPSFSSFVGRGMLSAAVAGTIFASPSAAQVQEALAAGRLLPAQQDVLVIVMNYTGDVLNFGVAVEKAKALAQGKGGDGGDGGTRKMKKRQIDMVVVGDDVGVGRARSGKVGRRGIAGTVLVVKIAGALAARGHEMEAVANAASLAAGNIVSVGASLSHVHVPGREAQDVEEEMAADEVEIGMGIHNEPGSGRFKLSGGGLPALVAEMLRQLLSQEDLDRAFLAIDSGRDEVVLLVNNLGGVSVLEMGGVVDEVVRQLASTHGIVPARVLAGSFMTSLNGMGFSISLLRTVAVGAGMPSMLELLDDEAEATGWTAPVRHETWEESRGRGRGAAKEDAPKVAVEKGVGVAGNLTADPTAMGAALAAGLRKTIEAEGDVTRYDTIVGDGDCGITLKRGAEALMARLAAAPMTGDVVADVAALVPVVEQNMDGTSGALYAIFLHGLVNALRDMSDQIAEKEKRAITTEEWTRALRMSLGALAKYTVARPGDRTLMDALYPFVKTLEETGSARNAAAAARAGADSTKGMKPGLGRSVYVGGDGYQQVPDPGAYGLAAFLDGVTST